MLFVIFSLSVITLELIMRYDAKSGNRKDRRDPGAFRGTGGRYDHCGPYFLSPGSRRLWRYTPAGAGAAFFFALRRFSAGG